MSEFEKWFNPMYGEKIFLRPKEFFSPLYNCWSHQQQKINLMQKMIDELKETNEFYSNGGNSNRDIWHDKELGALR